MKDWRVIFLHCQQTNALKYVHHTLNIQDSVTKLPRIARSMLLINQKDKTQVITSSNIRVTRSISYQRSAPDRSTQEGIN